MNDHGEAHRRTSRLRFLYDFRALFIKTFRLTIRKPGQTIVEILLAYAFLGFLLGMRYILDRRFISPYQIARFRPQDFIGFRSMVNTTYYYPGLFLCEFCELNWNVLIRQYLCIDHCE